MEETKLELTRRGFLRNGSVAVGAVGLVAGLGAGSLIDVKKADAAVSSLELPVLPLDVEKVRMWGYCEYHANNGCGQGSGRALVMGFIDAAKKAGMKKDGLEPAAPEVHPVGRHGRPRLGRHLRFPLRVHHHPGHGDSQGRAAPLQASGPPAGRGTRSSRSRWAAGTR